MEQKFNEFLLESGDRVLCASVVFAAKSDAQRMFLELHITVILGLILPSLFYFLLRPDPPAHIVYCNNCTMCQHRPFLDAIHLAYYCWGDLPKTASFLSRAIIPYGFNENQLVCHSSQLVLCTYLMVHFYCFSYINPLQLIRTTLLSFFKRKILISTYAFAPSSLLALNSPAVFSSFPVQILYFLATHLTPSLLADMQCMFIK